MRRVIDRQPRARQDIREVALYLGRQNSQLPRRFLKSVDQTFDRLATQRGSGTRVDFDNPALADLCVATVTRFKSYLVYYLLKPDRIEVIRVVHGRRGDIDGLLSDSLDPN